MTEKQTDELHGLLTELAGPRITIDPATVKERARRLEAGEHRRRVVVAAAACLALLLIVVLATRPWADDPQGLDMSGDPPAAGSGTTPGATEPTGGRWAELARMRPTARNTMQDNLRTLVWTGREVVIPGGPEAITFDPSTNTFGALPPPLVETSEDQFDSLPWVWTGREIIRFDRLPSTAIDAGGTPVPGPQVGQAYDPATRTWRRIADPGFEQLTAGQNRFLGATWAGDRLLAWGDGIWSYDPVTDRWDAPVAGPRGSGSALSDKTVWTGSELVQVGDPSTWIFDPERGTWGRLPGVADVARAEWTGNEVVAYDDRTGTVLRMDLDEAIWHRGSSNGFVDRQFERTALWDGDRFVVWGGRQWDYSPSSAPPRDVWDTAAWDPDTDAWSPLPAVPESGYAIAGVRAGDRFLSFNAVPFGPGVDDAELVAYALRA